MVNLNEYIWALVQLLNPFIVQASLSTTADLNKLDVLNKLNQIENCCKNFLKNRFSVPPSFFEVNDNQADISLLNVNNFIKNNFNLFL